LLWFIKLSLACCDVNVNCLNISLCINESKVLQISSNFKIMSPCICTSWVTFSSIRITVVPLPRNYISRSIRIIVTTCNRSKWPERLGLSSKNTVYPGPIFQLLARMQPTRKLFFIYRIYCFVGYSKLIVTTETRNGININITTVCSVGSFIVK
jgi:hypothetical protein